MPLGFWVVGGTVIVAGVLVLLARWSDRLRGFEPGDVGDAYVEAKTHDPGHYGTSNLKYDSMNDHGNRDADGGL